MKHDPDPALLPKIDARELAANHPNCRLERAMIYLARPPFFI